MARTHHLLYRIFLDSCEAIAMIDQNIDELRAHFLTPNPLKVNQRFREGFISYSNDNDTSILLSPIIYPPRTNVFMPQQFFYAEFYVRIENVVFYRTVSTAANSRWDFQAVAESREMQSYIIRVIYDLVDGL